MPRYLSAVALTFLLGGCAYLFGSPQNYSVFFQPYSAALDTQANQTIQAAAEHAMDNARLHVVVQGYAAPPDPGKDVDGLSADRAEVVKRALIADGVPADRIMTQANGVTDPKTLPSIAVRRVDITFQP